MIYIFFQKNSLRKISALTVGTLDLLMPNSGRLRLQRLPAAVGAVLMFVQERGTLTYAEKIVGRRIARRVKVF